MTTVPPAAPEPPEPTPASHERLVRPEEVPPHLYARIRLQMGAATYRGIWPVGIRR